ncbi:hypothetical protein AFLA_010874 [Aspergillus flavus NRRL3357]|nr:hypothetical protein AFLA_010874 [Aspergillus flavus NRRL3357]
MSTERGLLSPLIPHRNTQQTGSPLQQGNLLHTARPIVGPELRYQLSPRRLKRLRRRRTPQLTVVFINGVVSTPDPLTLVRVMVERVNRCVANAAHGIEWVPLECLHIGCSGKDRTNPIA